MEDDGLLGTLGNILSAPRKAVWRAFGGPETGAELVSNWTGLEKESPWAQALGLGAEVVGDPLTWVMSPALWNIAGKGLGALRAAKAANPSSVTRFLAGESGTPAWRQTMLGLRPVTAETLEDTGLAAGSRLRPLAENVSRFRNVEMLDPGQTDQMLAMSRAGGELPEGMYGAVIKKGAAQPVGFTAEGAYLPPGKGNKALARALNAGFPEEELAARSLSGTKGIYYPGTPTSPTSTAFTVRGAAPEVMRHELGGHAFTREAARQGLQEELPGTQQLASRLLGPSAAPAEERGFKSGLGMMLDEMGAFAKEARNPYSQAAKAAEFLMGLDPATRASYIASFSRHSPLVAELYRDARYLPHVGAGLAATGLGSYMFSRE